MKIVFLIPPSESKSLEWTHSNELLCFNFTKPFAIAQNASQKDLKCKWKRYEQARLINQKTQEWPFCPAIQRYNWVMFKAIGYETMSVKAQEFFDNHFLIVSWLHGLVHPQDKIANYKLPIETKNLREFWWEQLTSCLINLKADIVIDLLPWAHKKVFNFSQVSSKVLSVDFYRIDNGVRKKVSHGVKTIKGKRIRKICETGDLSFCDTTDRYQEILIASDTNKRLSKKI